MAILPGGINLAKNMLNGELAKHVFPMRRRQS